MQRVSLCVQDVSRWFMENSLLLNTSKTEAILFGTRQRLSTMELPHGIDICGTTIAFGDAVKLLGVTLDSTLSLDRHVTNIVRSCNYHIRALRHIRSALTLDAAKSIASSIVGSRLDYCNSLLYGTTDHNLQRLQKVQNSLAHTVCSAPFTSSATELRKSLNWLPIRQHVVYKTALVTYKTLHSGSPAYLADLLCCRQPARDLRSSARQLLQEHTANTDFGSRAFYFAAPRVWNHLKLDTVSAATVGTFKSRLKTELFDLAYAR